ncbi:MAG: diaminopimelate epimerase [Acidimicrobiaceae bacterium]
MRLTKHHGLGNDFLVLLDVAGDRPASESLARAVCDRHRGIGADGLLRVGPGRDGAPISMELRNADGGRAEMSGNGIACLVQAALLARLVFAPTVVVATDAGLRTVRVQPSAEPRTHQMTVDMGEAKIGDEEPWWAEGDVLRAVRVDVGNPHLVLHVASLEPDVDLVKLGAEVNELVPGGLNVELVAAGPGAAELTMQVYERGVGLTEACGTGAVAVAVAAHAWDLAPERVTVHQPGGDVDVTVDPATGAVELSVPVVHIATVDWPDA